jgi:ribosome maturation factor RimP
MGTEEEIALALAPTVRAAGLEIWDIERSGASVRVLVERPGGVDLDAISELSGAVSAVLDGRDDLVPAGRYLLEVSSPGLERRLRHPRHFVSSIGEEVTVKTTEPFLGSRRLTGTLVGVTGNEITLSVELAKGERQLVTVPLSSVERAHVVFKWPAPRSAGAATPLRPPGGSPSGDGPGRRPKGGCASGRSLRQGGPAGGGPSHKHRGRAPTAAGLPATTRVATTGPGTDTEVGGAWQA